MLSAPCGIHDECPVPGMMDAKTLVTVKFSTSPAHLAFSFCPYCSRMRICTCSTVVLLCVYFTFVYHLPLEVIKLAKGKSDEDLKAFLGDSGP